MMRLRRVAMAGAAMAPKGWTRRSPGDRASESAACLCCILKGWAFQEGGGGAIQARRVTLMVHAKDDVRGLKKGGLECSS